MSNWKKIAADVAEKKAAAALDRLIALDGENKRMFVSSSFQTQSLPLLHIISRHGGAIPVIFLDTGYHFPETLAFRDSIVEQLQLNLINVRPATPKSEQMTADGRLLFAADTDKCCYLNKVLPLEPYLRAYDVWINGVRSEQSASRSEFYAEQPGPHGVVRYHPMIDWTAREVFAYREFHGLPEHPLEQEGYVSIGCMPCTRTLSASHSERSGRWSGQSKTECGLHTDLGKPTSVEK